MYRIALWTCLLAVSPAFQLGAQQRSPSFQRWALCEVSACGAQSGDVTRLTSASVPRRDYRYDGLLLGGATFAALGAWIGFQISDPCPIDPVANCAPPDRLGNAITAGLIGATIGGGLGYLVGRLSSKRRLPASGTAP
jgi:hypothetical protein